MFLRFVPARSISRIGVPLVVVAGLTAGCTDFAISTVEIDGKTYDIVNHYSGSSTFKPFNYWTVDIDGELVRCEYKTECVDKLRGFVASDARVGVPESLARPEEKPPEPLVLVPTTTEKDEPSDYVVPESLKKPAETSFGD